MTAGEAPSNNTQSIPTLTRQTEAINEPKVQEQEPEQSAKRTATSRDTKSSSKSKHGIGQKSK